MTINLNLNRYTFCMLELKLLHSIVQMLQELLIFKDKSLLVQKVM